MRSASLVRARASPQRPRRSLFAIGVTPVECVATDSGGNAAGATVTVTVLGAVEQLARMLGDVVDATNLPAALKAQLTNALRSLVAGSNPAKPLQRATACVTLRTFTTLVRVLAPAHAAE